MVKNYSEYIPDRGDIIWFDFSPSIGHEQGGRRPALVLSAQLHNKKTGLALVCPVTSQVKGYIYEVFISGTVTGVILTHHLKTIDWKARRVSFAGCVDMKTVTEAQANVTAYLVG